MVEVGPFVPGRPTDIPFDEQDFSPTDSHELSDVPNEELEQRLGESSSVSQERLERHGKPVADSPSPFVPNAQVASAEGQRISQNNFQMQPFGDSVGPVVSVRSDLVSGHAGPDTPIDDLFFPKEAQLPGAIDESAEEEEDNPGNSHESFIAAKLQGSLNRSPVPKGSSPTFSKPEDKATGGKNRPRFAYQTSSAQLWRSGKKDPRKETTKAVARTLNQLGAAPVQQVSWLPRVL